MGTHQLVVLAVAGEAALVVLAIVWSRWRAIPLEWGAPLEGVAIGFIAAVGLALANWYVLRRAPARLGVPAVRRLYHDSLKPMFGRITALDAVIISLAAGVGEEMLFRGVMQPELGLVAASVIFGLLHTGGRGTMAFGVWVTVMGAALGGLAWWTGGLLAPVIAHAAYDAAAITYIRWDAQSGPR